MSSPLENILLSMEEREQLKLVVSKIKEIRKQKSVSQLELAIRSNMSQSFLASVESGKKQPSVLTLLRIANALNVNPKSFFPDSENKSEEEIKEIIINLVRSL